MAFISKLYILLVQKELENFDFRKNSKLRLNDYEQPKILIPDMLVSNRMGFDTQGEFFTGSAIHCPIFNEIGCKVPEKVYLAILNSNLFWFFISNTARHSETTLIV